MKNLTRVIPRLIGAVTLLAATIGLMTAAQAGPEKTDIKLGYASMSGAFGSFWIAEQKGYFKEQGLNVELLHTRTTVGLQALSSGHIDAMGTGCAEFFEATRKGYENRIVASLLEDNLYMLAGAKEITRPEQLVGKSIAVNRIGDTGHLSVRYGLRLAGVNPDKITYLQVGSTPERFSALSRGAVAGAVQAGSLRPLVLKNKLNILIDLQKQKIPSCMGAIGLKAETIKRYPNMVEALLRAIVKGNAFMAAGSDAETKNIYSKYMKLAADDNKLLLGWRFFAKEAHSRHPKMTTKAARSVMDMMAELDPHWKSENPDRFMDLRFMEKLEKSGFLENVYKELGDKAKM